MELDVANLAATHVINNSIEGFFLVEDDVDIVGCWVGIYIDASLAVSHVDSVAAGSVQHGDAVEVESGTIAECRERVVDQVAVSIASTELWVDATHGVDDTDVSDIVDVDGRAVAQFFKVERSTESDAIFACQVIDVSRVDRAVATDLASGLRERRCGKAHEAVAVRANFDESQFEETVAERVFEDSKVVSVAVGDGLVEGQSSRAAVAEADDIGGDGSCGADSLRRVAKGYVRSVGVAEILRAADHDAFCSPSLDTVVVESDGSATLGAHGATEGAETGWLAGSMDFHWVNVGVPPILIGLIVGAVDNDAGCGVGQFFEVAISERLSKACVHHAVMGAAPVVARSDGEGTVGCGEVDVGDETAVLGEAEARVGGSDVGHHVGHGLAAVEAIAPSESCVGPVDSEDGTRRAGSDPIFNCRSIDGSLFRSGFDDIGDADRIDGIRPYVSIVPVSAIFADPRAVGHDSNAEVAPFVEVAVVEHVAQPHTSRVVEEAEPVVARSDGEGTVVGGEVDVGYESAVLSEAEARVGCSDVGHHSCTRDTFAVEAIAPSEGGVGPVDSDDGFVGAVTDPIYDCRCVDGGIFGNRLRAAGDSHGVNFSVPHHAHRIPRAHVFGRVVAYAEGRFADFELVAIGERGIGVNIAVVADDELHVACRSRLEGEREGALGVVDSRVCSIGGDARVGRSDGIDSLADGDRAVEAEAPSESGVGHAPVDDDSGLVGAGSDPVDDVVGRNSGVDRHVLDRGGRYGRLPNGLSIIADDNE